MENIIATRTTFDGVTVYLHSDGSVSDRLNFFRAKLPIASMWRAFDDVSIYTHAEIPSFIREAKGGKWSPAWIAGQVASAQKRAAIASVPEAERCYRQIDNANGGSVFVRIR